MNRLLLVILLAGASFLHISFAQTAAPDPKMAQLQTFLKDLQVQQTQIVANQAQIETKLAAANETIRVARIFASRGGR